ncbi:YusW family protein [Sporosarcina sp. G11-34]|uniref:YusW family protein n=1 Tax=Sporosarcina sp. G11-34 TaxID=2849605 RepID=UPI0022A8E490|nr:YusW family protein [Sporosarcina sp. G11-34]MCZ2260876.1 YusW family protein [Sporosarcina sp. G11-34]
MNKRIKLLMGIIITTVLIMGACSNQNIVTKDSDEEDSSTESLGSKYGFIIFNLEADTKEMKGMLIVNYEEKRDKTEAVYENKGEDLYLHGDEAMDKLESVFEELDFEPDMAEEDLIKKASETFEVMDYTTIKLTIKFKGHDTKALMMSK